MNDPRYPIGKFTPPPTYTPSLRSAFISAVAALPQQLRAAVAGLNEEQRLTPYRDGGWTVAQVVHHLADSHMHAIIRFKFALAETEPTIKAYDENDWAELSDSATAEIADSLDIITGIHSRWTRLLRALVPEDFNRVYLHPERGRSTLDRTLALYAWHGEHHVAHITSLRARKGW